MKLNLYIKKLMFAINFVNIVKFAVYFTIIIVFLIINCVFYKTTISSNNTCCAFNVGSTFMCDNQIADELSNEINDQYDDLELDNLENWISTMSETESSVFGYDSFRDFVMAVIKGEETLSVESVINILILSIRNSINELLPWIIAIVVVILLYSLFTNISTKFRSNDLSNIVYIICFGAIISLIFAVCSNKIDAVKDTIYRLQTSMNMIFPVLLTLITAVGGIGSSGILQPLVVFLSSFITNVFVNILLPIVLLCFVFTIIGKISSSIKLDKLVGFLKSLFKWILGTVCSLFMALLSIKAFSASSTDGISVKATKYALKNYIPYLGGYLSEGFEIIRAGSTLLKNSIGIGGVAILLSIILIPLFSIVVISLLLKLTAGLTQPLSDGKLSDFLNDMSKCLSMLITLLIGIGAMFFITLFVLICCANYVF